MRYPVIALVAALATLAGCAERTQLTAEEIAALPADQARWIGTFDGTWGGDCTGSLKIWSIAGSEADVTYAWGFCGNSNKGSANRTGAFEGEALVVRLFGRTNARYTFVDEDTIEGKYTRPKDGSTGRGLFRRVAAE